jgi:hypothetical protein
VTAESTRGHMGGEQVRAAAVRSPGAGGGGA